jgi:HSP20 family molecular chaperone IbpA
MMIKAFRDLLTTVDVLNTVNGGVSEPSISLRQNTTGREMHVRVPGIKKEALQVEVSNNELSIFYLIPVESSGKLIQMPRVVYNQALPYFIEVNGIKATHHENELIVKLPFNELSDGYSRKIQIEEE